MKQRLKINEATTKHIYESGRTGNRQLRNLKMRGYNIEDVKT